MAMQHEFNSFIPYITFLYLLSPENIKIVTWNAVGPPTPTGKVFKNCLVFPLPHPGGSKHYIEPAQMNRISLIVRVGNPKSPRNNRNKIISAFSCFVRSL